MTELHKYTHESGNPGDEVHRRAVEYGDVHKVDYQTAVQRVLAADAELARSYSGREPVDLPEPESAQEYRERRERMATAGEEVDARASQICREEGIGYTAALRKVFAEDPALAARYARGE